MRKGYSATQTSVVLSSGLLIVGFLAALPALSDTDAAVDSSAVETTLQIQAPSAGDQQSVAGAEDAGTDVGTDIATDIATTEEQQPEQSTASQVPPSEVQDLRYGVILYHFFQQEYFDALTESLVGEQRLDMPYHQQSAKLLRGGMSLSYGMGQEAETIFRQLLGTLQDEEESGSGFFGDSSEDERRLKQQSQRDRAWFYLGKLYYVRGEKPAARAVLANIQGHLPEQLIEEYTFLKANLALYSGELAVAESTIADLPATSPWLAYYYFNRGAIETKSGDWEQGVTSFELIDTLTLEDEEGETLRDRAYTAAGYANLAGWNNELAINNFLKVRRDSPMSEKAMLGYGWAAAQAHDYSRALIPWQALSRRSLMNPGVQESLLAIPFVYEKLDAPARALEEYLRAVTVFEQELASVGSAIDLFTNADMDQIMDRRTSLGPDWIDAEDYLPLNEQAPYLYHLIAQDHFQEAITDINDLNRMLDYLTQSTVRLQALRGVLENQQQLWLENLGGTQRQEYRQQQQQMLAAHNRLQALQRLAEEEGDGRRFVTPAEQELWDIAEHATGVIGQLQQAGQDVSEEQGQLALFQGMLLWDANEQEASRRWEFKKQFSALDQQMEQANERLLRLEGLQVDRYEAQFAERLSQLEQRLGQQQISVGQSLAQSEQLIRQLAVAELENQQRRLSYYLGQAKLAVARLYDAGSESSL